MSFANLFSRRPRPAPRRAAASFVPRLTDLEDRAVPAVYTVTNTSGNVNTVGSLPWAVQRANYTTPNTLDYINFAIPGSGLKVITISDTLYINDQTVIDGKSQPGYNGSPLVAVRGTSAVPSLFLIQNDANDQTVANNVSTIQGLELAFYTSNAVTIFNSSQGNYVQDNWIGFGRPTTGPVIKTAGVFGTSDQRGIGIASSFNTIRGNTISGVDNGIVIADPTGNFTGTSYRTNSISDNRIGTDPSGTTSSGFGNTSDGVFFGAGAQNNFIGPFNTLSGNASAGVELLHPTVTGNVVFRNAIGTNATGTAAVPNGELGILIANGATGNAIGGPFGGNLISGNRLAGVALGTTEFPGAVGNYVQGNIIGLNGSQTAAIGGQAVGISISDAANSNTIQSNAIAGHTENGVVVRSSQGNFFQGNFIGRSGTGTNFQNGAFGVALLSGANFNFFTQNAFGANFFGPFYVDPNAIGNSFQ